MKEEVGMDKNIIVVDGFYINPDEVRAHALSQDFNITGNYPGARTKPFSEENRHIAEHLSEILNMEVDMENWGNEYCGSYQVACGKETTWIHADMNSDYSCIVYLHPDPAENSGTSIYKHKETGSLTYNDDVGAIIEKDGSNYDKWIKTDTISNKYNRAMIFRGELWHAADDYFGTDIKDGRMFQTFFFNIKK